MTTFDFEDGKGQVPAHKHPNGGGWVAESASVANTAYVGPEAKVFGNAQVYNNAWVFGNSQVYDNAWVYGSARVYSDAEVFGNARVYGDAEVFGNARVYGVHRSDGYTFCYVPDKDGVMRVIAGCRYFTMEEARKHWSKERGGTPLGDETMAILDFLEESSKVRPEGCV